MRNDDPVEIINTNRFKQKTVLDKGAAKNAESTSSLQFSVENGLEAKLTARFKVKMGSIKNAKKRSPKRIKPNKS